MKLRPRIRKASPPIGVDSGEASIKVAQLAETAGKWEFCAAGVIDCSGLDGDEERARELRRFLKESGIPKPWRAVGVLPGSDAEIRILSLPREDPSTLPERVMEAAEKALPFGTEDTIIDFLPMNDSPDTEGEEDRVLLAAAGRKAVDRRMKFFRQAGMIPEAIELAPWALARSIRLLKVWPDGQAYGVLDLGHSASAVTIFDGDEIFLSRTVRTSAKELTERLSKELELEWTRAEQLKRERGLSLAAQTHGVGVPEEGGTLVAEILDDLLLPALNLLVEEVEKSLRYYASETQGGTLDRLVLAGGGAPLRNLDLFLSDRLGLPVRVIEPGGDGPAALPDSVRQLGGWPILATAVGLSLRGSQSGNRSRRT